MNKAIFITVRTGSSRLPKKALLEICGKPTIEYVIQRAKSSKYADIIVLCTTELKEDDVLCQIAAKNEIHCHRGSTEDKLARWYGAAIKYNVDFFVTADGDDLFCEPELIDMAFSQYEKNKADFIEGKGLICGAFTYGIKTTALKKVCAIKNTENTEMMWVYFTDTGLFRVEELREVPEIFKKPEIRMTLDYKDDFMFFKNIIQHFSQQTVNFNLRDVLAYLDKNPDVVKINQRLQKEFIENQKNKTKLVIKKLEGCHEK